MEGRRKMRQTINIGIIGDFDQNRPSHRATNEAIYHAANRLSARVDITWLPTPSFLTKTGQKRLEQFDGIFVAPGSPYQSLDGALRGIQFARTLNRPFLGTCGGFQHALLEYARNVAGIKDAAHLEYGPNTGTPLLVLVSCPVDNRPDGAPRLSGRLKIKVSPDSLAFHIYQKTEVEEAFNCNYELNPIFRETLEASGLKVSGVSKDGGARIIELPDRRFFMATGFQPQFTSEVTNPHPLIIAYLEAALNCRRGI